MTQLNQRGDSKVVPRLGLSIREAATSVGLCETAFRGLLPEIPHLRAGRRVIIPFEGLKTWLEQQSKLVPTRDA